MATTRNNSEVETPSLQEVIHSQVTSSPKRRWWWVAGSALVILALIWPFFRSGEKQNEPMFVTEPAGIGTLVVIVSATGKLQPTNQVEVGSELSGIIENVFVDVNDRIQQGQELARLDRSKLEDNVSKSRANLAAAEAQVAQTEATMAEAHAALMRFRQVSELSGGKVPSLNEMDIAEATVKRAEANLASARAGVLQARATLQSDETNLRKASIRSPINGVVLSRMVDPGQTVAASFQAPVLFTLAEDLSKMELQVDVDEADVGQVQEGQKASFTVDAWPGRRYEAVITRVGYGSQEKDGVVSYLTVLSVNNDDLSLRPGMTGTADITTAVRENVLLVPNAALRFTPDLAAEGKPKSGGNVMTRLMPRPPRIAARKPVVSNGSPRVWVLQHNEPTPIDVVTGPSNGRMTEITQGPLTPGMQVITEAVTPKKS